MATCGNSGERLGEVTASARSLPAAINGAALDAVTMPSGTCPAVTSVKAGPQPLYGTCCKAAPVARASISPARCCGVPLPQDANGSGLPGCAASSASSRLRSALAAGVTNTDGTKATLMTAAKSRLGSKPRLR